MIIARYLGTHIFAMVCLVLFMLAGVDALFGWIGELEDISPSYLFMDTLWYVFLSFPTKMYDFLSVACLIGGLIALGQFASTGELTVLRAGGMSTMRIVSIVCAPIIMLMMVSFTYAEFGLPVLEKKAQNFRALKLGQGAMWSVRQSHWYRDGRTFINVNAIDKQKQLLGLTRYTLDEDFRLKHIEYAARSEFTTMSASNRLSTKSDSLVEWQMYDVQSLAIGAQSVDKQIQAQKTWKTFLTPKMFNFIAYKPELLAVTDLFAYANFLKVQKLNAINYELAFWKKVLQPLSLLVMVFLASSFIFGPLRSVSAGQRILVGLLTGLSLFYLQDLVSYTAIVFAIPAWLAIVSPLLLAIVYAIRMLNKA